MMKTLVQTLLFVFLPYIFVSQNTLYDSLIVYYPMNNSGNDFSGNNINAVFNGATPAPDRNGNANGSLYFDGTDDYLGLPNISQLKPELPITFSFWVKPEIIAQLKCEFVWTEHEYNNYGGYWMNCNNIGQVSLAFGGGSGVANSTNRRGKMSNTALVAGNWYHIVGIIRDYNDMDIFINCSNAGGSYTGSGSTTPVHLNKAGRVGSAPPNSISSTSYFRGTMDDFAFWNRALDPSEIIDLCNGGLDCNSSTTQSVSICSGDSLLLGGEYQSTGGVYTDTLINTLGCDSVVTTTLNVISNSQGTINGIVYYNGTPITSGEVRLINKTGNSPQSMSDVDSVNVNSDGSYSFNNVLPGNYLVKALGDTSIYDNVGTYGDSTNHWQMAEMYTVSGSCIDSLQIADIHLIDFPTTIGFGNINGNVTQGGNKLSGLYSGTCITLEEVSSGNVVQASFVDSLDKFVFNNIENGSYFVYLDLIGYLNDSLTTISVSPSELDYNLSLEVNDSSSTVSVTSVMDVTSIKENPSIFSTLYPNPTSSNTEIVFTHLLNNVNVSLYSYDGKLIRKSSFQNVKKINYNLTGIKKGLYHILLESDGFKQTYKIIKE